MIGFTGTRRGMSQSQKDALAVLLKELRNQYSIFHHGDCLGADSEAHDIAFAEGFTIHIHPCTLTNMRAFKTGGFVYPVREPLDRNRIIVDMSSIVIAAPHGNKEVLRSGTWATIRYAKEKIRILTR